MLGGFSRWRTGWPLLLVLLVTLLSVAEGRSPQPPPLKRIHHPTRSNLEILPRKPFIPGRSRSIHLPPHPASLLHSDTILLSIDLPSLLPFTPTMILKPTEHLFHPDAKITYPDGKFERLRAQDWKLYTGEVIHPNWIDRLRAQEEMGIPRVPGMGVMGSARVMVHEADHEPVWEGVFNIDGVDYHVLTREKYERTRYPGDVEVQQEESGSGNGKMVVFRNHDMDHAGVLGHEHDDAGHHSCSHDRLAYNSNSSTAIWQNSLDRLLKRDDIGGGMTMGSNFVGSIGNSAGCPSSQRTVYMGVALDCNYITAYGSPDAARTQVLNVWNQVSGLYRSTFNISLGITELVVQNATCPSSAPADATWNIGCDASITLDERLSRFSQWRGQRSSDNIGLWHLMSACATDSEVGVAWLGTLCQTTSNQQSGSFVSGTGVSTASRTEWSLVAHEIGHGFGAIHDCSRGCSLQSPCCPSSSSTCDASGRFIMNPTTSSTETNFSPCTLGNICSLLGSRATSGSCLVDPGSRTTIALAQCGNGIVDAGEDCDPGFNSTSACCDPSTCKFRSGAVCDPQNDACCTSSCQLASAGTLCRAAINSVCDFPETCTGTNRTCPADRTAEDGLSCGSNGLACASGVCTSLNQQCSQAGQAMSLTTACGQKNDRSCVVTCRDPSNPNQCVVLQTPLVDGSPCGYGGHCYNASCQSGSWQAQFAAMYKQNLQISIPVTIVVGIIVLLILFYLIRGIFRCCTGGGGGRRAKRNGPVPVPPQHPSMRQSQYYNGVQPQSAQNRHSDSVRSGDPLTQNGYNSNSYSNDPSPNNSSNFGHNYPYLGNGNGNGNNGHLAPEQAHQWPQRYSYQGGGPDFSQPQARGWVDESAYNGPYYGRSEAYGR